MTEQSKQPSGAYPLGDPDAIATDTVANNYLTADADGVTLARAYLDLKAQVSAVVAALPETEEHTSYCDNWLNPGRRGGLCFVCRVREALTHSAPSSGGES